MSWKTSEREAVNLSYASVNSSCAQPPPPPPPPPQADQPRALAFFWPWMENFRGWGLLSCQIPRGGTKKEGKCPVLRQLAQFNSAI